TDLEKARAICSFVITYLKYDINSGSRNSGALIALRSGSGVCEDYASLFAALCRASGIPARVVNGYCDPKGTGDIWNLSPGERFPLQGYRHSWVEFYLHGSGWIPADPTMDIQSGSMKYFGSLPQASHLAQNYEDIPLKVRYKGAQLSVTWEEELVGL
ncbi:MAG: transglutaminase domain-containing protein, partial [Firmicutes bacterium]|nr:transglutaminase domain-containing protein [Bacillota bacterium]